MNLERPLTSQLSPSDRTKHYPSFKEIQTINEDRYLYRSQGRDVGRTLLFEDGHRCLTRESDRLDSSFLSVGEV